MPYLICCNKIKSSIFIISQKIHLPNDLVLQAFHIHMLIYILFIICARKQQVHVNLLTMGVRWEEETSNKTIIKTLEYTNYLRAKPRCLLNQNKHIIFLEVTASHGPCIGITSKCASCASVEVIRTVDI